MGWRSVTALAGLLVLAAAVVSLRHYNRQEFAQLQALRVERDALNIEWSKLLLEEGAWSQHPRVELTARKRLGMQLPTAEQMIIIEVQQ